MVPLRAASGAALALVVTATITLAVSSCRCNKSETESGESLEAGATAQPPESNVLDDRYEGSGDGPVADASSRFLEAGPKVELDPDGPVDPVCTGPSIAFAVAVVDRRCAIGSNRAKALRVVLERDSGAPISLRQEATVDGGGRLSLRLINTGDAAVTLPLSWSAKLPSFTVLAEDEHHSVFELVPPRFEVNGVRTGGGGEAGGGGADASAENARAHFARIVMPPGGAAVATITVEPTVAKVLRRAGDAGAERCADGGLCGPPRLAKGRYVLHVGELLTDVEAGSPARVTWELP